MMGDCIIGNTELIGLGHGTVEGPKSLTLPTGIADNKRIEVVDNRGPCDLGVAQTAAHLVVLYKQIIQRGATIFSCTS